MDDLSFGGVEDSEIAGQLTGSDPEGTALTFTVMLAPTNGTLSLAGNGAFTYTPAPDFHGLDSFLFRASDGTDASNVAVATITVAFPERSADPHGGIAAHD